MDYDVKNKEDFIKMVQTEVLSSAEVTEFLGISRQSLNSLVKREKLVPIKQLNRDTLFLKEDVEKRKKEAEELHAKYRPYDK